MKLASSTAAALSLALVLAGCGKKSPEPKPAESSPATQTTPPAEKPAETEPAGPEIIDQAEGEQVSPINNPLIGQDGAGDDAADSGEPEEATPNPVASLPGFSPAPNTPPSAAAQAANLGTDQVLVQLSVFELTPKAPEDLAPIEQFLGSAPGDSLSPDEAGAFMEMVKALQGSGVLSAVSSPRVLVASGQEATIEVTQLGGGQVNGVPTARSALLFSVAPTVRRFGEESEQASVDLKYQLKLAEADSAFEVVAQNLGLSLGARAGAKGTVSVEDQRTFFFVRKVVGDDASRELLVLVRPQVMRADLTK